MEARRSFCEWDEGARRYVLASDSGDDEDRSDESKEKDTDMTVEELDEGMKKYFADEGVE